MSIQLHKGKGVNPRMTYCPRCRGDANELVLLGVHERVYTCSSCGGQNIGGIQGNKCGLCSSPMSTSASEHRMIAKSEKLPASKPCDKCRKEIEEHAAVVKAGGVYMQCDECGATGVIKPSPFATEVRAAHSANGDNDWNEPVNGCYPDCGVHFNKCEEHRAENEEGGN